MDAPTHHTVEELIELANDREQWRLFANALKYEASKNNSKRKITLVSVDEKIAEEYKRKGRRTNWCRILDKLELVRVKSIGLVTNNPRD